MELKIRSLTLDSDELKGISKQLDTIFESAQVAKDLFFQTDVELDYTEIDLIIEWNIEDFIHLNKKLLSNRQRAVGIVLTNASFIKFDWTNLDVDSVHAARDGKNEFYIADDKDLIRDVQYVGWVRRRVRDYGGIKSFLTTTTYDINAIEPWRTYAIEKCGLSMGYDIDQPLSDKLYTKFAEWYVLIYNAPLTPVKLVKYSANYDHVITKEETITYNGETFNFVFYKSK